jgi:SAM-dependent methyltransferase
MKDEPVNLIQKNREQLQSETDPFTPGRYRQFLDWMPRGCHRVLDAGCNTGRGGAVLKTERPDLEIIGIDCVPERVAALDRSVYCKGLCSLLDQTGIPDRSVDVVFAGEVIEHIEPDKVDRVLAEWFRILRLKGRIVLTTPNPGSLRFRYHGWSVLLEESHLSQHPPRLLRHRLRMIGFRRVRTRGSGRISALIGTRWPLAAYGSYLVVAEKW